jgi:hypothetical protein
MDYDLDLYYTTDQIKLVLVSLDSVPSTITVNIGGAGIAIQIAAAINVGINKAG